MLHELKIESPLKETKCSQAPWIRDKIFDKKRFGRALSIFVLMFCVRANFLWFQETRRPSM